MTERYRLDLGSVPEAVFAQPLVFDTNVWLFINGPFINLADSRHKIYSNLYSEALKRSTPIYIPQIVLWEYIRQSVHQYAKSLQGDIPRKIHHHDSYQDWMVGISDEVFHIADACQRLDDNFLDLNLDACLGSAAAGKLDFNDVLLSDLCISNGMLLVTDDSDYASTTVPVASSNRRFFKT